MQNIAYIGVLVQKKLNEGFEVQRLESGGYEVRFKGFPEEKFWAIDSTLDGALDNFENIVKKHFKEASLPTINQRFGIWNEDIS